MSKQLLFSIIFLFTISSASAINEIELTGKEANDRVEGAAWIRLKEGMQFPSFVKYQEWARPSFDGFVQNVKRIFKLPEQVQFSLINSTNDELGMIHHRF